MLIFHPRLLWRTCHKAFLCLIFYYAASSRLLAATAPSEIATDQPAASPAYVKRIIIAPAKHLSNRERRKLFAPYLNSFLSPARIQALIDELQAHYIIKGYPTTQVYRITDPADSPGTIRLKVIHGFIEQIRLGNNRPWERRQIATAFPFSQGGPLYLPVLSQGIDVMNNVPSNGASMTILPGSLTGGSIVQINNPVTHRWRLDLGIDNLGEQASGKWRGKVNIGLDNLLSLHDVWTLHASLNKAKKVWKESKKKNITLQNVSFMTGLAFSLGAYRYSTSYNQSHSLSPAQAHIEAYIYKTVNNSFSFHLKRPLSQGVAHKTFAEIGLTRKESGAYLEETLIGNQSRKLSIANSTLSYTGVLAGGQANASVSYHKGLPIWGALKDAEPDSRKAFKAQFKQLNLSFLWVRLVPLASQRWLQYRLQYASQHSRDRLYSSEQMSLSGMDRIRGLLHTVSHDKAIFVRQEIALSGLLRFSRLTAPFQPFIGLDAGYILDKEPIHNPAMMGWAAGCRYQGYGIDSEVSYARMMEGYKLYMNISLSLHQLFY